MFLFSQKNIFIVHLYCANKKAMENIFSKFSQNYRLIKRAISVKTEFTSKHLAFIRQKISIFLQRPKHNYKIDFW
jgi:hypothetical protein